MYEAFFECARRPFSATPDAGCWFSAGPFQPALDELLICAEQGQGIGILVGPAGSGKSALCERLMEDLRGRFEVIGLHHATFVNRRALLQTILSALNLPIQKATDQELRLELGPALRQVRAQGRSVVLVVDEAHELPEPLLEELRILADQAEHGHPLVRLILAGQAGLEEKLVHPGLQALNQRVRAQVVLPALTAAESLDYIDFRLTWAGARTTEVFDEDALTTLIQIADGSPRCLSQLCDHTLLLAYVAEQRPVTKALVLEALDDLKHLPLRWNLPQPPVERTATPSISISAEGVIEWGSPAESATVPASASAFEPAEVEELAHIDSHNEDESDVDLPTVDSDRDELEVYRLSSELLDEARTLKPATVFDDATPDVWTIDPRASADVVPSTEADCVQQEPSATGSDAAALEESRTSDNQDIEDELDTPERVIEEEVIDRYAALDAGLEPPLEADATEPTTEEPAEFLFEETGITWNSAVARLQASGDAASRLAAVQHVLDAVATEPLAAPFSRPTAVATASDPQPIVTHTHTPTSEPLPTVFEFGSETPRTEQTVETSHPGNEPRNYRRLFTMLRRKQARS